MQLEYYIKNFKSTKELSVCSSLGCTKLLMYKNSHNKIPDWEDIHKLF